MWLVYQQPAWLLILISLALSVKVLDSAHCNFYLIDFLAGMSIVSWGSATKIPAAAFWPTFMVLLSAFYTLRPLYKWATGQLGSDLFGFPWINLGEVALVTPLVAAVFYHGERFSYLSGKLFNFLGETSFSIYLTHWIVIVLTTNALIGIVRGLKSTPGIFWLTLASIVLAITIPLPSVSHRWIELPGISLGKLLASWIAPALGERLRLMSAR